MKGVSLMAVAEESLNSKVWSITVRHVVLMALGAALYAGLSYITNTLQGQAMSHFVQVSLFLYSSELSLDPGSVFLLAELATF
jgi:hypothetical protein